MKKLLILSSLALALLIPTACGTKNESPDNSGDDVVEDVGKQNLNNEIKAAQQQLEAYAASKLLESGKTDDGTVASQVAEGKQKIATATTSATVNAYLEEEKTKVLQKINAIVVESGDTTDYQALKTSKQNELDAYKVTALSQSGKTDDGTVLLALNNGLDLIANAENNVDKINIAFESAKKLIDDAIVAIVVVDPNKEQLTYYAGLNEAIALEWNDSNAANAKVYYKSSTDNDYTKIDSELVRNYSGVGRADILGLPKGTYSIKVEQGDGGDDIIVSGITVYEQDRSGYAHFKNTTGVGAYDNTGKLKSNAKVIYVTDETKNTVQATINGSTQTGLVSILKAATSENEAVDVRIIGSIKTQQWNSKTHGTGKTSARQENLDNTFSAVDWVTTTNNELKNPGTSKSSNYYKISEPDIISYGINSMSTDVASGITHLDGLTNNVLKSISDGEYDSYYNELDVKFGNNITVEGVGTDASIYQWGFCFNQCNSVEVKNIEFSGYTEDAVGIQGASSDVTMYSDYWIHNCTFNSGKNNWDVTYENDKNEGDGSTDLKYAHDLTISYCRYNGTHKTALIGSSETSYQYNITFHHNYYNACGSRLPFTRNSNLHIYNCYYYGSTGTNMQVDDTAYAFIEGCYFEGTKNTFTTDGKKSNGYIKLYNNEITSSCSGTTFKNVTTVTSRTQSIGATCTPDKVTDYSTFDTNSELFYYDSTNKASDVLYLTTSEQAKNDCVKYSGTLASDSTAYPVSGRIIPSDPEPDNDIITATHVTSVPTEAGFYARILDGSEADLDLSTSNTATMSSSEIKVIDTNDNATTYAYYMFDETYTTGVVEYSLTFSVEDFGSKWNMVQFMDGQSSICVRSCGVDTSLKNMIGYSCKGTSEDTLTSTLFEKNKNYEVILTIDYTNSVVTLSVGGYSKTLTGYTPTAITGVCFQTAKAATTRNITSTIPTVTVK